MRRKAITSILLVFAIMLLAPSTLMAGIDDIDSLTVQPRWSYIVEAENDFSISGTTANVDCRVTGHIGDATKAKVIAELQLKSGSSWIAYGTWTDTQNGCQASVYENKTVKTGQTYRVKATYTVWEGSDSETTIIFSDEVTA